MHHWILEQFIAFGILCWLWNRLGLPERVTLIGNILAMVLLLIVAFFL